MRSQENLIARCIKQDKQAWCEFVEQYSALVCWAVQQRLSRSGYHFTEEDVSDIHQDVFFSIWRDNKLAQLKDKNKLVPWLSMAAGNKAADYFKLIKRIPAPRTEPLFEEEIYSNDIINLVDETIEEFTHQEKIVLRFNLLCQKTHQEIAELLNIPVNTVSTIISRSKEKLKEKLIRKGIKDF